MRLPWTGLLIVAALAAVCYAAGSPARPAALPVMGVVPAFSLTSHAGLPLTRDDLRGTPWIAEFVFTRCAGQCPLMAEQTVALRQALAGLPVRFVSFTVDAAHDTPEVLAAYARRYDAQPGKWDFVTGDPAAIQRLATEGFALAAADGGTPEEPITHSVRLALVDRQGRIRGSYDATDPHAMARLRADARRIAQGP